MRKLLILNNYHYRRGGADVAYLAQAQLFGAHGWRVAAFSMQHRENLQSEWARYFVDEIEYDQTYSAFRTLKNAAKSIYSWEAATKIEALIENFEPQVAHAHNIYHHLSPSVLQALKRQGVPVYMTLHDVKLLCPARTMWTGGNVCEACKGDNLRNVVAKRCMKNSLALSTLIYAESTAHRMLGLYERNVDKFVSPSRFVMNKFIEWGWPAERFAYIPNFVDATEFSPAFKAGQAFLYFGRLSIEKGVATLIKAAASASVPLWIVGTGPEKSALETLAQSLGGNVTFFGFKTGDELWRLIGESRAIVLPSEWYENAPISILEAYSLGKPVIGARIGGIPEMVLQNQTGALYESKNVGELSETLKQIASAPNSMIEQQGRRAREWVITEFSPERHYERLLALYSQRQATLRDVIQNPQ